mmetsp:Transcript_86221/g.257395  ORF Transcript_86221/g.257395 Transcript_86221/m.257395 type:complete len:259 (+) Transcript_86221:134-910(+)
MPCYALQQSLQLLAAIHHGGADAVHVCAIEDARCVHVETQVADGHLLTTEVGTAGGRKKPLQLLEPCRQDALIQHPLDLDFLILHQRHQLLLGDRVPAHHDAIPLRHEHLLHVDERLLDTITLELQLLRVEPSFLPGPAQQGLRLRTTSALKLQYRNLTKGQLPGCCEGFDTLIVNPTVLEIHTSDEKGQPDGLREAFDIQVCQTRPLQRRASGAGHGAGTDRAAAAPRRKHGTADCKHRTAGRGSPSAGCCEQLRAD